MTEQLFLDGPPMVPSLGDPAAPQDGQTHHDPIDTEVEAAERPGRETQRVRVLQVLAEAGDAGASDYEIARALGILRTSAGKRRLELLRLGWVTDTGQRRPTDTATTAAVWALTDAGREAWRINSQAA